MTISIEPAAPTDFPSILALLDETHLPPDGLSDHLGMALVAREGTRVVGCAALEHYGAAALLRSVAVMPAYQGQGLGLRITGAALELARRCGVREVYLLTETAGQFFPRFGFRPIDRAAVPAAVQQSVEFTSVCPISALVLRLDLAEV